MAWLGGHLQWRVPRLGGAAATGLALSLALGVAGCLEEAPSTAASSQPTVQPSTGQAGRFEQDPEAVRTFHRVTGDFQRYGYPLNEDVEAIRALHAKYPDAEPIIKLLDAMLHSLSDYEGLYQLHASRKVEDRSAFQQFYVGYLLVRMSRYDQAAEVLAPLAEAHPNDPHIAFQAAFSLMSLTRYDEAEALLARPGVDGVDPPGAALLRGQLHLRRGDFEKAKAHLEQALRLRPEYLAAINAMTRTLHGMGDAEGAVRFAGLADQVSQKQDEDQQFRSSTWVLSVEWRQGSWRDCVSRINSLLSMLEDDDLLGKAALLFLRSKAHGRLGLEAESAEDLRQAQAYRDEFGSGLLGSPSPRAQMLMRQAATLTN